MRSWSKDTIESLGVGLSFRTEIAEEIYQHIEEFDFFEVVVDAAICGSLDRDFAARVPVDKPITGHGLDGSLGSMGELDRDYFRRLAQHASSLRCRWLSDHLAYTRAGDFSAGQLLPVRLSRGTAERISERVSEAAAMTRTPFLIENIAYYFAIPGSNLSELEFILSVLEMSDCGMLLDVNNLYANARNHGFDAHGFIDELPADRVIELHVAGGEDRKGLYIDTHGHAVSREVLELVEHALETTRPKALLLEREKNFPPVQQLVEEVKQLRKVWTRVYGA